MLEANSWAWTDLCLTLPAELTDRDAIAGPTTEVSTALAAAETRATSNDGRSLAAELQQAIAARPDRDRFVRINLDNDATTRVPERDRQPGRTTR